MTDHRGASKITYIIELFALSLVIVVVLYFLQSRTTPSSEETNTSTNQSINAALTDSTNTLSLPADSDQDGLSNDEETTLGTNPNLSDSDNDGLIDYDEVKVYTSDPLKADTDGDGNGDGAEVRNGYSPNDDSKLLDLNREKEQLN
ncbi:MAG: hypothetical protein WC495_01335 [Patescibacteria group bacterium]